MYTYLMSNEVQFDFKDEQRPKYNRSGSKLARLVVKLSGGRADEAHANYILLGFAVLAIIVSLFLFFGGSGQELPPEKVMG